MADHGTAPPSHHHPFANEPASDIAPTIDVREIGAHLDHARSTGQVARLLGVRETRLNDLIRRGQIHPTPEVSAGRRMWLPVHVAAAAATVGVMPPAVLPAVLATLAAPTPTTEVVHHGQ